jgi:1-acyl-sn-glycerol-3-phosphate acyltransferase
MDHPDDAGRTDAGRTDAGGTDADRTIELAISDVYGRLPLAPETELRDQLPGLESERRIDDWGRSERIEKLIDRTLFGFLYHYWFRVEVEGIENVPSEGGALLLANRTGGVLSDGAMIAKAVRDEHPRGRLVHVAAPASIKRVPVLGMLATKVGVVGDHPANLRRLLLDEREIVLAFPEALDDAARPFRRRYQLREFASEWSAMAGRAGVPIVPVAVIGGEEAAPLGAALGRVPTNAAPPLPAKFRLRVLQAVPPDRDADRLGEAIRALIQENLLEMLSARHSVWLG